MRHKEPNNGQNYSAPSPCGLRATHELLSDLNIRYWLDSGSLLGLVRHGREIPWDTDIDVGIWAAEIPKLIQAVNSLPAQRYAVARRSYRGSIYGFTIADRSQRLFRPIHVHVYFQAKDVAWSPQTVVYRPMARNNAAQGFAPWPRTRKLLLHLKDRAQNRGSGPLLSRAWDFGFCYPAWGLLVLARNRLDRRFWTSLWPYSCLYAMYTWVIPASHFEHLDLWPTAEAAIPIPSRVKEYLSLRYGKWEIPVSNWCYWTDDGCILPQEPAAALHSLTEMKKNDSRHWEV